jgi:hypothetical protein
MLGIESPDMPRWDGEQQRQATAAPQKITALKV